MATVNGQAVVFNSMELLIDGESTTLNGYIQDFNFTTGSQSGHVPAITPNGENIAVNSITNAPEGSFTFSPGKLNLFYQFLNDRYSYFNMVLRYYVVGQPAGDTMSIAISSAKLDTNTGSGGASRVANTGTVSFKAISIKYI